MGFKIVTVEKRYKDDYRENEGGFRFHTLVKNGSLGIYSGVNKHIGLVLINGTSDICFLTSDDVIEKYNLINKKYYLEITTYYGKTYYKLVDEKFNNVEEYISQISVQDYKANFRKYYEKVIQINKNHKVLIRYHKELYPSLEEIEVFENGDFVDLRSAEYVNMKAGEFKLISLGVSMKLPEGYWGQLCPRSSLFNKHGILVANSFGVIDESYCGDDDIWKLAAYATRDTLIEANERIAQFRIVKKQPFVIETVEKLDGENRGGFGSTGTK